MPKSIAYKTNSVIYFKGDRTSYFYVLKSGKVIITNSDDVNSAPDSDKRVIGVGEFFGVRAALSGHATDETAIAAINSDVIALTHAEFESVASQNSNIILKLLKVYSKQLADVHNMVKDLMSKKSHIPQVDDEEGLYNIALYFLRNRLYGQAVESFKRYLIAYPEGKFASEAQTKTDYCQPKIGSAEDMNERFYPLKSATSNAVQVVTNEATIAYDEAKALFEAKKYAQGVLKFGRIVRETDPLYKPYIEKSEYFLSESLFNLQKYSEVVAQLSLFFQRYPESEDMQKALYLMARSYEALNDKNLALVFYQQLYTMLPDDSPLKARVKAIVEK